MGQVDHSFAAASESVAVHALAKACELVVVVRLVNMSAIALAYGEPVAQRLRVDLASKAAAMADVLGAAAWSGEDLEMVIADADGFREKLDCVGANDLVLAHEVERRLRGRFFADQNQEVIPCLVTIARDIESEDDADEVLDAARRLAFTRQPDIPDLSRDRQAVAQYRRDMAAAVLAVELAANGGLALLWQPVASLDRSADEDEVLYWEGLTRLVDSNGQMCLPSSFIPALERLGLVRVLDAYNVSQTLSRLERDPSLTLGCNISAQSVLLDGWWAEIISRLQSDRTLAQRLVLEITESASFPGISLAVDFVDHFRRLGCRIAIDDFGVGHAAFRYIAALQPDIVKIDALFLRRAASGDSAQDHAAFKYLVGLAGSYAAVVVVEGIEHEAAAAVARDAGAIWGQGYHFGQPSRCLIGRQMPTTPLMPPVSARGGFGQGDLLRAI
ncbi:EAL domain-containing protein [Sphingobium sp. B11D3A]|uniref:EAL domain-containing protein n=1 Tax=Sphingobium sp. B11D3A TaxID=2940574 RepID=UPI00222462B2|nr:EAL domain-containing protein [Sphingobium sp. B11D3A]MCW2393539.1 EAL domain-containing protein (putative c-di-GMP-specific phosphodiesterase class I) [Sphingobium sp. B11D3A]